MILWCSEGCSIVGWHSRKKTFWHIMVSVFQIGDISKLLALRVLCGGSNFRRLCPCVYNLLYGLEEFKLTELILIELKLTELILIELKLTELILIELKLTELILIELKLTELILIDLKPTELILIQLKLTELILIDLKPIECKRLRL